MLINLENLGMSSDQCEKIKTLISSPYGMLLVIGPPNSGKNTTLYAILNELDRAIKNIITVENHIRYCMPGISQIKIDQSFGLTFFAAIRTILPQDPDVIMVSEICDSDTAEIAIKAALGNHLVLSTLQANNASEVFVKLWDMGIQPSLIASAIIGVISQRLLRAICPECKEFYRPSPESLKMLDASSNLTQLARGKGCNNCGKTGYKGHTGIYEILEMDDDYRQLAMDQATPDEIRKKALAKGITPLNQMAQEKILQGISTIEEFQRLSSYTF
jgi:type IV pilus assembly protein PilB